MSTPLIFMIACPPYQVERAARAKRRPGNDPRL
jgi:hypothetical protein